MPSSRLDVVVVKHDPLATVKEFLVGYDIKFDEYPDEHRINWLEGPIMVEVVYMEGFDLSRLHFTIVESVSTALQDFYCRAAMVVNNFFAINMCPMTLYVEDAKNDQLLICFKEVHFGEPTESFGGNDFAVLISERLLLLENLVELFEKVKQTTANFDRLGLAELKNVLEKPFQNLLMLLNTDKTERPN